MNTRWTLFFEPLDVLLFRDTRPLDPGVSIVAHSVWPGPGVFYGCIRAALLRHCGATGTPFQMNDKRDEFILATHVNADQARRILGGPNRLGSLTLRGPLLAKYDQANLAPYFPIPRDLVLRSVDKNDEKTPLNVGMLNVLKFGESDDDAPVRIRHGAKASIIDEPLPFSAEEPEKAPPQRFLTEKGMCRYLRNDVGHDFLHGDDYILAKKAYEQELRVGITRNVATHATEEGMYYVTRPYRFASGYGFAVDVDVADDATKTLIEALDKQVVPLGGKGHQARVIVLKNGDNPMVPADFELRASSEKRTKRVFVTPLPLPWPEEVKVQCLVTERAIPVGGYDLAKRAPKPLERALPAGTVVWTKGDVTLHVRNDAATTMEQRMGYGFALGGASET